MAFDLIARTGGKQSNSFIATIAEADTLIADLPDDTTDWNALKGDQKNYRLVLGASMMSMLPLKGYRSYDGQALCFPRNGEYTVPDVAKYCQAFLAYSVVHRGLVNRPDIDEMDGDRVTQVSLGGLLTVSFAAGKSKAYTSLDKLIMSSSFPAYVHMMKYLTSFRGRSVPDADELDLLTTTTTT